MIRLNDINKTVISETKIKGYGAFNDYTYDNGRRVDREAINIIFIMGDIMIHYDSKKARDKDIELLDKIFDVKSIEDKANAYPHEIDALKFAMSGIKKECEPVKEEYLTWEDVKSCNTSIKAEMPNGNIRNAFYNNSEKCICIKNYNGNDCGAYIFEPHLFNALMLKKVE